MKYKTVTYIFSFFLLTNIIVLAEASFANTSKDTIFYFYNEGCCFREGGESFNINLEKSFYKIDISAFRMQDNSEESEYRLEIFKDNYLFNKLSLNHYGISDFGVIVNENENYIFLVGYTGGTGVSTFQISVLKINNKESINITLSYLNTSIQTPFNTEYSENYYLDIYSDERNVVEKLLKLLNFTQVSDLKYDYNNYKYATDLWLLYNEKVNDGKLEIIKYRLDSIMISKIYNGATITDIYEEENIKYVAYFKGGLECFDLNKMEYYVLYFPGYFYNFPTVLRKYKNYIIIGTRGEGVVIINLNDNYIKRYYLDDLDVFSIKFLSEAFLVNDTVKLSYPDF